jgi:prenyltransferase/squalene oxidase-like repeat protein
MASLSPFHDGEPSLTVFRHRGILEVVPRPGEARSGLAAVLIVVSSTFLAGAETARRSVPLDGRTGAAVDRGLAYLIRTQEASGSWTSVIGRKVHVRYVGHEGSHVGVTALAGMSFLVRIQRGGATAEHRLMAERALRYITERAQADGFITEQGSRMYSHAFATLFLARACRSDLAANRPDVKSKLEKAVALLVGSQNAEGGWRYLPGANDSDLSVAACQLVALRAARDAGVEVPEDTFRRGLTYVKGTYVDVSPGTGAFRYQLSSTPSPASRHSFALAAAGLAVLAEAGESSSKEARAALEYLRSQRPSPQGAELRFDYYYAHQFAMKAFCFENEEPLVEWHRSVAREFLDLQKADGSWIDLVGPTYATAMATLVLQEPCSSTKTP